jgi:hypothetical protein
LSIPLITVFSSIFLRRGTSSVAGRHVVLEDSQELRDDIITPKSDQEAAIHVDRGLWLLEGAG